MTVSRRTLAREILPLRRHLDADVSDAPLHVRLAEALWIWSAARSMATS